MIESEKNECTANTLDLSRSWRLGYFNDKELPEYVCMLSNSERFKHFQQQHAQRLRKHFYLTVVPKTLDLLEWCLGFLPRSLNVFLILNGLSEWEQHYIENTYPHIPAFRLDTLGKCIMYDRVLDMLIENNDRNFGVFDPDCFVIDRLFFWQLRLEANEFAVSPFVNWNETANIQFPRTYFLYFNIDVIKRIRDQYSLSFKRCWTIPANVEDKLAELKLGYSNFPHKSLSYFDNFQLIWATAMSDHLSFSRRKSQSRQFFISKKIHYRIIHLGAGSAYLNAAYRDSMMESLSIYKNISQLDRENLHAAACNHYAHLLLLEHSDSEELKDRYLPFFSVYKNSQDVLQKFGSLMHSSRINQMNFIVGSKNNRQNRSL